MTEDQRKCVDALETKEFLGLVEEARKGDPDAAEVMADGYEDCGFSDVAEDWREKAEYLRVLKKSETEGRFGNIAHLTPSQVKKVSKVLRSIGSKLPKYGWCVRLPDGSEICRDRNWFYMVGLKESVRKWVLEKRNKRRRYATKGRYK